MIWVALVLLALAALIVVIPPLLKSATAASRVERDLAVYRDQLAEIDRDRERGLISAGEADAARTEIKRRILALGPLAAAPAPQTSRPARGLAAAVAASIAVGSAATYLALGRPSLPARPYDAKLEREEAANEMVAEVDAMVAKLAAKLKAQPNDAKGWRMLGWSYLQLGRVGEAIEALTRAVALDPQNSALRSQLGEALVRLADGTVTPAAVAAFDEALKLDAKDPRARFYKGLALSQTGQERAALAVWVALLNDGPKDAEWFAGVQSQARDLAAKLKLDPKVAVP